MPGGKGSGRSVLFRQARPGDCIDDGAGDGVAELGTPTETLNWGTTMEKPTYANCPDIAPVTNGAPRPYWSVMIPTFNCANYLRETLESVLAQDPGPQHME